MVGAAVRANASRRSVLGETRRPCLAPLMVAGLTRAASAVGRCPPAPGEFQVEAVTANLHAHRTFSLAAPGRAPVLFRSLLDTESGQWYSRPIRQAPRAIVYYKPLSARLQTAFESRLLAGARWLRLRCLSTRFHAVRSLWVPAIATALLVIACLGPSAPKSIRVSLARSMGPPLANN